MRFISLRIKIAVVVILAGILFGVGVVSTLRISLSGQFTALFQKRAIQLAEDIAMQSASYILTHDLLEIRRLIDRYQKQGQDIKYIFIEDARGEVLVHTFKEGFPVFLKGVHPQFKFDNAARSIRHFIIESQPVVDIAVPIFKGEVGFVHVGVLKEYLAAVVNKAIDLIVKIVFIIVFLGCFIGIVLSGLLIKPILELVALAKKVGQGDLSFKSNIKTSDEIEELATAFNSMVDNLQKTTVSRQYLNNIVNSMINMVVVTEKDGSIKDVNESVLNLLGFKKEELLGRKVSMMISEPDGNLEDLLRDILEGRSINNLEKTFNSKSGKAFYVLFSASAIRDNEGHTQGIVFVAQDITSRKYAEEELINAFDSLKHLQAQLVQTEKMAAIGQLAGGVAHEINNPLTGVLNNVQLIKMLQAQKNNINIEEFKELLDAIEESALRCKNITQSLLDYSHASIGEFKSLDLNQIIGKIVSLVQNDLKLQNIILETHLQPELPVFSGDQQLIQQVVTNIFSNAKYAIEKRKDRAGNGVILVKTWCDRRLKKIYLSICDNGMGIPADKIKKIFEPFFTTKLVGEGTGLGLSVVYSIIKKHQGNISVESKVNEGTTFTINFPFASELVEI